MVQDTVKYCEVFDSYDDEQLAVTRSAAKSLFVIC